MAQSLLYSSVRKHGLEDHGYSEPEQFFKMVQTY